MLGQLPLFQDKKNNDHKLRQEQNVNFDMRGAFRIWVIRWRRLLGYVLSFEATVMVDDRIERWFNAQLLECMPC